MPKNPRSAGDTLPYFGTAKEFKDAFVKKNSEKKFELFMRVAIAVFLRFEFQQAISPANWSRFLPNWIESLSISAINFTYFAAVLEIVLDFLLLLELYTQISALILSLHLLGIAFNIRYSTVKVRPSILALANLNVFMNGADMFCLDKNREH